MKCIRCGSETVGSMKICYSCLGKWSEMRETIFNILTKKYGKLSKDNHSIFVKETKRLEKIWRKDKRKFLDEINKIKQEVSDEKTD